jgi:epsilon-lactone hydrolase
VASIRSRLFYSFLRAWRSPLDPRKSIEAQRRFMDREASLLPTPRDVRVERTAVAGRPAEWLRPARARDDRAIIYFHGGGYAVGSPRSHRAIAAHLGVAAGAPVLVPDYRLAPEDPFPAAVDDAVAAARSLYASGLRPEQLALAGDSAGGGLALAACLALREGGDPLPGALVCFSPWTDLALTGASFSTRAAVDILISREVAVRYAASYAGEHDPRSPLISPLYADLRGLPPLLVQVGDYEVLRDDSVELAKAARQAGVDVTLEVWDRMWHVFQAMCELMPESKSALEQAGAFVDRHVGG